MIVYMRKIKFLTEQRNPSQDISTRVQIRIEKSLLQSRRRRNITRSTICSTFYQYSFLPWLDLHTVIKSSNGQNSNFITWLSETVIDSTWILSTWHYRIAAQKGLDKVQEYEVGETSLLQQFCNYLWQICWDPALVHLQSQIQLPGMSYSP